MADDIRVVIDERAVAELARDWSGPVGDAIDQVTGELADLARTEAPVSATGSKGSPPGALKLFTRESLEHHHDDLGNILGLVGAPRYPYNFLANPTSHKGYTRNRGGRSVRRADDDYLNRVVDQYPFHEIGE